MFTPRTHWDTTPHRLAEALQQRRRRGLPVVDLTESNPTRCGFDFDREAIAEAVAEGARSPYEPDPKGLPAARDAIPLCDLIFIDGGHSYETVRSDWSYCLELVHPGSVIFFDDYPRWGVGRLVDGIDRAHWNVAILEPGDTFDTDSGPATSKLARVTSRRD